MIVYASLICIHLHRGLPPPVSTQQVLAGTSVGHGQVQREGQAAGEADGASRVEGRRRAATLEEAARAVRQDDPLDGLVLG
jgi:hypothetical protein